MQTLLVQNHLVQDLLVAMLVIGSAGYAGWKLMPAALRRSLAGALLKLPLPDALNARFRRAATASSGCGCDGCDHAPKATPAAKAGPVAVAVQPITFHPRTRH